MLKEMLYKVRKTHKTEVKQADEYEVVFRTNDLGRAYAIYSLLQENTDDNGENSSVLCGNDVFLYSFYHDGERYSRASDKI